MKKYITIMLILMLVLYGCTVQTEEPEDSIQDDTEEMIEGANNTVEEIQEEVEEPEIVEDETMIEENETIEEEDETDDLSAQYDIVLTAEKKGDLVELSWTRHEGDFRSYKVVRSLIRQKPEYPTLGTRDNPVEEDLIATIINRNQTTFTDNDPEGGVSYYAVTALGMYNEKTHSNPVVVEFQNPKETPDQDIILTATKTEKGVELSWTKYEGDFLFYKVVWTNDHPYPKYPDDKTIETIAYVNTTTYVHTDLEPGINYYAVTIVRPDKSRFTSHRDSVVI